MKTVIQALVEAFDAKERCLKSGNSEWEQRWDDRVVQLIRLLPSGSGIDNGTKVISVTATKLVLQADFHHMNDAGMYDGWTEHQLIFKPRLDGYLDVRVTGRDRNDIKDYLADTYLHALQADAPLPLWLKEIEDVQPA